MLFWMLGQTAIASYLIILKYKINNRRIRIPKLLQFGMKKQQVTVKLP